MPFGYVIPGRSSYAINEGSDYFRLPAFAGRSPRLEWLLKYEDYVRNKL